LKIKDGGEIIEREELERVEKLMREKLHLPPDYQATSVFVIHNEALSIKFNTHIEGMKNNARVSPHLFRKNMWKEEGDAEMKKVKEWYVEKLEKMIDDIKWNERREVILFFSSSNNVFLIYSLFQIGVIWLCHGTQKWLAHSFSSFILFF